MCENAQALVNHALTLHATEVEQNKAASEGMTHSIGQPSKAEVKNAFAFVLFVYLDSANVTQSHILQVSKLVQQNALLQQSLNKEIAGIKFHSLPAGLAHMSPHQRSYQIDKVENENMILNESRSNIEGDVAQYKFAGQGEMTNLTLGTNNIEQLYSCITSMLNTFTSSIGIVNKIGSNG